MPSYFSLAFNYRGEYTLCFIYFLANAPGFVEIRGIIQMTFTSLGLFYFFIV